MKQEYGINIVASNSSFGGRNYSQAFYNAIQVATEAGIVYVASAGNNNVDNDAIPHYPASYDLPGIISVAATDKNDSTNSVAEFTNFGATSGSGSLEAASVPEPTTAIMLAFAVGLGLFGSRKIA